MYLNELKVGESCRILAVKGEGALRQHFLDMGLIPGAEATLVKFAPMGDPMEIRIHGYELTLRLSDAANIETELIRERSKTNAHIPSKHPIPHPGLGEGGKYHKKENENPLSKGTTITFGLVGNQNCGKTTLFNRLTGSSQHVGNFPGVTVDRKDGMIKGHPDTRITDLPGIYSLSPYTSEEIVTRQFVLEEKPKGIINIVDATNIERNLYLTMQVLELGIPMVVALNMMDEVTENGGYINVNAMEKMLGVPVIPISAAKNQGIDELIDHAIHVAKYQEVPEVQDYCEEEDMGGAVHRCIHAIMHLIYDHCEASGTGVRFAADKLAEGEEAMAERLCLDDNERQTIEHMRKQMEKERGLDASAAVADMRFRFIARICEDTVVKPSESKEHIRSRRIDQVLTGKYTGIPMFVLIMSLVFYLTFNVIGKFLEELMETGLEALSVIVQAGLVKADVNVALQSLIIDGIFKGVGTVLCFLPVVVTLFFFLSILEDSGYIARVAFVMDKLLRKIGLSGRSIVPMLIGFGCTVPGVMACRTLASERDRKMTTLLTPFMSCSAKLPVYVFFIEAFFPTHRALVMVGLYFGGILLGILVAKIMNRTIFQGDAIPFVMELPNYRLPGLKNVGQLLWEKAKDFLLKAFTVIFIATIVIWILQTFDLHFNAAVNPADSMLAMLAGKIAPLFAPMRLNDWRIATALISGLMAKESVVATLSVLFPTNAALEAILTPASVLALLAFCLLYTPCVAAIASIRRELGRKWAALVVIGQCTIAWVVSYMVYILVSLF